MAEQELRVTEKQEVQPSQGELTYEGTYFTPAVDIYGTEKELVLMADLPGVNGNSVEVDLRDDILTIVGKVSQAVPQGEQLLTEYQTGNYYRSFRITEVVDQSRITASMSDGVLKLVLPKVEKAVPRKIPITAG